MLPGGQYNIEVFAYSQSQPSFDGFGNTKRKDIQTETIIGCGIKILALTIQREKNQSNIIYLKL